MASAAASGGFTKGRLPPLSAGSSSLCKTVWRLWSYISDPCPSRSRVAPT